MYSMVTHTTCSTINNILGIILAVHDVYYTGFLLLVLLQIMGHPSPEQKKSQVKNQKMKRKLFHKEVHVHVVVTADSCTSEMSSAKSTATCIGDVDIDHVEMQLYNCTRKQDGEGHSYDYLLNCREKLMDKIQQYKDFNTVRQKNAK